MKVTQVTHGRVNPDGDNGITRTVYNIHENLISSFAKDIWSFDDRSTGHNSFKRDCGLEVELFGRKKFGINAELKRHLKSSNTDLFHFHLMWIWDKNALAKEVLKANKSYICTTHAAYTPDRINSFKKRIAMNSFELEFLKGAKAIHALCKEEKFILRELGLENKIYVIPNGISDREYSLISQAREMVDPYDRDFFQICWVGRLRPDKNVDGMINALSLLPKSVLKKIKLNLIGGGSLQYEKKLKNLVIKNNLCDHVEFHGSKFSAEKYNFIDKADMYLQPSFSEGVSFSLLDALACGTPTVISRQSNMNYYVPFSAFEVIEPFAEDISDSILNLFDDSSKRDVLRSSSQDLVRDFFYWPRLIKDYQDMYLEVNIE